MYGLLSYHECSWNQYVGPINGAVFFYSNTFCESLRLFCVGAVKGEKNPCGFVSLQFGTH